MKVLICLDEEYFEHIYEANEGGDQPWRFLPVEIPDALWQEIEAARLRYHELRRQIITQYGPCPENPDFEAQWQAYMQSTEAPLAEPVDLESAWEEYEKENGP